MSTKKLLITTAMVILLTTGAILSAPIRGRAGEEEQLNSTSDFWFEIGTVDVETDIIPSDPYHHLNATYTRDIHFGELPERYVFRWETMLNGEHLYTEELESEPVTAEQVEYTVETSHRRVVPDRVPEGEYTTILTVYAEFEDGSEMWITSGFDTVYFEGHNTEGCE